MRLKTGDSDSWSRIHTEMPRSAMERRKGMRQPHSSNLAVPIRMRVPRITSSERKRPRVAVVWMNEVK
jgi:hypothetical protein